MTDKTGAYCGMTCAVVQATAGFVSLEETFS